MEQNESLQEKYDGHFSKGHIPPLYGDNFRAGNITWKRLSQIAFDQIGRVLVCHLLIEAHLDKFIELSMPRGFSLDKANMTFSQNLAFMSKHAILNDYQFVEAIHVINKIRNDFSHNIETQLSSERIDIIVKALNCYSKNKSHKYTPPTRDTHTDLAIIEEFTSLFCAFFSGATTSLTGHFR